VHRPAAGTPVGPGSRWLRIAALQAARCPECGGDVFRPMPLQAR